MSFVAAAFLSGLALLAVPWWLHRREQHDQRQRPVSSLMLMRPSEEPLVARKVLRNLPLLALRLLLMAALVLAFSQPVLERPVAAESAGAQVLPRLIAMDTSLSMTASLSEARRRAHQLVDDLAAGGRAAVVSAGHELTMLSRLTGDRGALHAAVDAAAAGNGRLDFDGLGGRLTALADTLADGVAELHLVSDFQASAMPDQFNGLVTGVAGPVTLHAVEPDRANWLVERITVDGGAVVTVRGIGTPERELEVTLTGSGGDLGRRPVRVPAGGRATATFPLPANGTGWLRARVDAADVLAADDVRVRALHEREPVLLPVFASPGAAAHLQYLDAAVAAAAPRFHPADPVEPGPVAVLVDPGTLPADRLRVLERHLDNGGALLVTVGPATRRAGRLPFMEAALDSARPEAHPRGVRIVDGSHPALAGLAGMREVTVSRHLVPETSSGNLLLALDDGSPLLVEHRLGPGRMLVLMTALDPVWSSLVTQPAFVSLIAGALDYLAGDALPDSALAGEPLSIPAASVQLFDPDGRRMLSLEDSVGRPSVTLAEPGVYTLRTPSRQRLLAVNTDPRESDLTAADAGLLARWEAASRPANLAANLAANLPANRSSSVDRAVRDSASRSAGSAPDQAAGGGVAAEDGDSMRPVPLAPVLLGLLALLAVLEPAMANAASAPSGRRRPS